MKKTVILGASNNSMRYSYMAAHLLKEKGYEIIPLSIKKGEVAGEKILNIREKPQIEDVHTITMYVGPKNQADYYDYILDLNPERIIFNPGSENQELEVLARRKGIKTYRHCTLVMLNANNY